MTDTTTAPDAAILAALACVRAGHAELDGKSQEWHEDDANADELKAIWDRIDKAERDIHGHTAETPAGAAALLWMALSHSFVLDGPVRAVAAGDLSYFTPETEAPLDRGDRLVIAALRSLEAMAAPEEIAYLRVARAWLDRWEALGGTVGLVFDLDRQPKGAQRGMLCDLDLWRPTDTGREDIPPHTWLQRPEQHEGAVKALEGLLALVPPLKAAVSEIGGRKAFGQWAVAREAQQ